MFKKYFCFLLAMAMALAPFFPARAISYLNTYPEKIIYWDGTSFNIETGDAQTDAPGDVLLGRDAAPKKSAIYITMGHLGTEYAYFDELYFNISQAGQAGEVIWEYYSASLGWNELAVVDETESFTKAGWNKVSWSIPEDWVGNSVDGNAGRWIRARTISDYTIQPLAGQIEIRAYNLRVKVENDSAEAITGLTTDNFALSNCDDTNIYGVREIMSGVYELALQARATDTNCDLETSKIGYSSNLLYNLGEMTNYVNDLTASPIIINEITGVSAANSDLATNKETVLPDGIDAVEVTVIVRDAANRLLSGYQVILNSSRGEDVIAPDSAMSDSNGLAVFEVTSETVGQAEFSATAGGVSINDTATVDFQYPGAETGSLIKLADDGDPETQYDSAVYYYSSDGKRYAFPNDKVFFSWYDDFSSVEIVTSAAMADIRLGGNVAYRPGSRMVKIQSDPKTYAVARGGVLRWVVSEEIAEGLYGADWNRDIDDVDVAFWVDYSFGENIESASDYDPAEAMAQTTTIDQNLEH